MQPSKTLFTKKYAPIILKQPPPMHNKPNTKTIKIKQDTKPIEDLNLFSTETAPLNCPQNVNCYRHILTEKSISTSSIAWSFNLREYAKNRMKHLISKVQASNPPSFYSEDVKKFLNERMKRSASLFEMQNNTNWNNLHHLTKDNFEKHTNPTLIQFSSTLRSFPLKKSSSYVNPKEWNGTLGKPFQSFYMVLNRLKESKALKKIDKYLVRPYIEVIDKAVAGKETVKRRKRIPNQLLISECEGYHLSSSLYSNDYHQKNIGSVEFIVDDRLKNTSQVFFELGMREYNQMKDNKRILLRPPNQRKRLALNNKANLGGA